MNFLKKGPQLKFSGIKIPQTLRDLYYDLDDRHLLPVVAVLLVAIVAAPILLAGSSESDEPTPQVAPTISVPESSLTVAKATPRIRDYKKRLGHLDPRSPFVLPGAGDGSATAGDGPGGSTPSSEAGLPATEESLAEPSAPESSGSEVPIETGPGSEVPVEPLPGSETTPSEPRNGTLTYFSEAIDVRVVPVSVEGKKSHEKPTIRKNLPPLVMLPNRETPALTYVATSKDGKKAVMLVSSDVTGIFGDGKCIVGSEHCQLLALEEGVPETIVFGPSEKTFRVELRKIELVETENLNVDPLGEPKKDKEPGTGDAGGPQPRGSSRALERLSPAAR